MAWGSAPVALDQGQRLQDGVVGCGPRPRPVRRTGPGPGARASRSRTRGATTRAPRARPSPRPRRARAGRCRRHRRHRRYRRRGRWRPQVATEHAADHREPALRRPPIVAGVADQPLPAHEQTGAEQTRPARSRRSESPPVLAARVATPSTTRPKPTRRRRGERALGTLVIGTDAAAPTAGERHDAPGHAIEQRSPSHRSRTARRSRAEPRAGRGPVRDRVRPPRPRSTDRHPRAAGICQYLRYVGYSAEATVLQRSPSHSFTFPVSHGYRSICIRFNPETTLSAGPPYQACPSWSGRPTEPILET